MFSKNRTPKFPSHASNPSHSSHALLEPLESRQFLSVAPLAASDLTGELGGKLPYTAIAGQNPKIQQNLLITNSSDSDVNGDVTANLYLSTDGAVDANAIEVGTQGAYVYLRPYDQFALHYKVTSTPNTTPAGNYQVVAQITDPDGNVSYAVSGLTIAISPPSIDLTGSFTKPLKPGKNGKTKVAFTLANQGNTTAAGTLTFNVYDSTTGSLTNATYIANDFTKINLKGHKTKNISETIPLPAGTYQIVIQLDPNNVFNDTNLANNVFASASITVT